MCHSVVQDSRIEQLHVNERVKQLMIVFVAVKNRANLRTAHLNVNFTTVDGERATERVEVGLKLEHRSAGENLQPQKQRVYQLVLCTLLTKTVGRLRRLDHVTQKRVHVSYSCEVLVCLALLHLLVGPTFPLSPTQSSAAPLQDIDQTYQIGQQARVVFGRTLFINCHADGYNITYSWNVTLNRAPSSRFTLRPGGKDKTNRISISNDGKKLTLQPSSQNDDGNYSCIGTANDSRVSKKSDQRTSSVKVYGTRRVPPCY